MSCLSYAARIMIPGSAFPRRLFDALGKQGIGGYILAQPDLLQFVQEAFCLPISTRHRHKDIQFKEVKFVYHAI